MPEDFEPPPEFSCSFYECAPRLGESEVSRLEGVLCELVNTHGAERDGVRDALAATVARDWCRRLLLAAQVDDAFGCPYCQS